MGCPLHFSLNVLVPWEEGSHHVGFGEAALLPPKVRSTDPCVSPLPMDYFLAPTSHQDAHSFYRALGVKLHSVVRVFIQTNMNQGYLSPGTIRSPCKAQISLSSYMMEEISQEQWFPQKKVAHGCGQSWFLLRINSNSCFSYFPTVQSFLEYFPAILCSYYHSKVDGCWTDSKGLLVALGLAGKRAVSSRAGPRVSGPVSPCELEERDCTAGNILHLKNSKKSHYI